MAKVISSIIGGKMKRRNHGGIALFAIARLCALSCYITALPAALKGGMASGMATALPKQRAASKYQRNGIGVAGRRGGSSLGKT